MNKNIGIFSSEALQKSTKTCLSHGLPLKEHEPKICLTLALLLRKHMHMTDSFLQGASPIKKADTSLKNSSFVRKSAKNMPHILEHPTFYFQNNSQFMIFLHCFSSAFCFLQQQERLMRLVLSQSSRIQSPSAPLAPSLEDSMNQGLIST